MTGKPGNDRETTGKVSWSLRLHVTGKGRETHYVVVVPLFLVTGTSDGFLVAGCSDLVRCQA